MHCVSLVLIFIVTTMASASDKKEKPHLDVANAESLFEEFIVHHERKYKDAADKEVHFRAFVANLEKINKLNEGSDSATYGINKFADFTEEERQNMFGIRKPKE